MACTSVELRISKKTQRNYSQCGAETKLWLNNKWTVTVNRPLSCAVCLQSSSEGIAEKC